MNKLKLVELLKMVRNSPDYSRAKNKNLFETYAMLGELLNPENSCEYSGSKGWYTYEDRFGNTYFVRLTFMPVTSPFFELKTGWIDDDNKPRYDPPLHPDSSSLDWDKRSDTVAKIFKDELLPFFMTQNLSDVIKIKPISLSRYQFSIRLVNKFVDTKLIEIIENKPKEIILRRK